MVEFEFLMAFFRIHISGCKWYNLNPNKGWPGDLLQVGCFSTGLAIGFMGLWRLNEATGNPLLFLVLFLANPEDVPRTIASLAGVWLTASVIGFITKRVIDRILPESMAKKRSLLEIIQPPLRRFMDKVPWYLRIPPIP